VLLPNLPTYSILRFLAQRNFENIYLTAKFTSHQERRVRTKWLWTKRHEFITNLFLQLLLESKRKTVFINVVNDLNQRKAELIVYFKLTSTMFQFFDKYTEFITFLTIFSIFS